MENLNLQTCNTDVLYYAETFVQGLADSDMTVPEIIMSAEIAIQMVRKWAKDEGFEYALHGGILDGRI